MSSHGHPAKSSCSVESAVSGTFSALHLLRNCSYLSPTSDFYRHESYPIPRDYNFLGGSDIFWNTARVSVESPSSPRLASPTSSLSATVSLPADFLHPPLLATVPPLMQSITIPQPVFHATDAAAVAAGATMTRHFVTTRSSISGVNRRARSEKKPTPDDQKDDKYYERRKRNNQAAKKSRDARKIREEHIALRASMLEHENAILRTQIVTLREEAQSLRRMLIRLQRPTGGIRAAERVVSALPSALIAISPSIRPGSTTLDR